MLFVFSYRELFSYPDLFFIEIKNFDKTRGKFLLEIKHDIFQFKTKLIIDFSLSEFWSEWECLKYACHLWKI